MAGNIPVNGREMSVIVTDLRKAEESARTYG
jgi:hypothetical protein